MQNWEEYEADYYGGCPCERTGAGRGNGRRSRQTRPEDYPDRRFLGAYGGEVYDENAYAGKEYDGDAYVGKEYGGGAYAGKEYGGDAYAGEDRAGKPGNRRPYVREEYGRETVGRDAVRGRAEDNGVYSGGRLFGESREETWDGRQRTEDGAGRKEIAGRTAENDRAGYRVTDDEVWKDLDEFEGLYDELEADITEIIRRICDTIDGDGCAAMEGQMSREMLEMLIDRVLEELRRDGQPENGGWMRDDRWQQPENGEQPGDGAQPEDGTDGEGQNGRSEINTGEETLEAGTVSVNDAEAVRRSLISSLLFHELLRRRMRRRMHRRNRRGDFRDRWRG